MKKGSKNSLANRGKVNKYFVNFDGKEIEISPSIFADPDNNSKYTVAVNKADGFPLFNKDKLPIKWHEIEKTIK